MDENVKFVSDSDRTLSNSKYKQKYITAMEKFKIIMLSASKTHKYRCHKLSRQRQIKHGHD